MNKSRREFVKTAMVAGVSLPLFNIGRAGPSANGVIRHASFGAAGQAGRDIRNMIENGVQLMAVAEIDDAQVAKLKKSHHHD